MSFNDVERGVSTGWGGEVRGYQSVQPNTAAATGDDEYVRCHQEVFDNIKKLTNDFNVLSKMTLSIGTEQDSQNLRDRVEDKITELIKSIKDTQALIKRLGQLSSRIKEKKAKGGQVESGF